jgi:hypothetical protein
MALDLAPNAINHAAESFSTITDAVPGLGNAAICVDSLCTAGRAGINFYCSPSPLAKVFFGASFACGTIGAVASGTVLVTSYTGIPTLGWVGGLGSRGLNRLDKYTLHIGNVTNTTEIADLMS